MVSTKKYWKKRNKRTDKISRALDQALGISGVMYTMPKSFNGAPPTAYNQRQTYGSQASKKPVTKKKKSKLMVLVIDTQNPNKIKVRGFKAKQKHAVKKKEKKKDKIS